MLLKIGYQHVKVEEANLHPDAGKYHDMEATITIDQRLSQREKCNTLIHECLHACFHTSGLRSAKLVEEAMEEQIVTTLSNSLTAVFLDNPHLLAFLQQNLHNTPHGTSQN